MNKPKKTVEKIKSTIIPHNEELTLYIADRKINKFMESVDLKPLFKWYVKPELVKFSTTAEVNREYCMKIINGSKTEETFWIPAILYKGEIISDSEIKIISDGKRELFI